jgi:hypothetical protein
MQLLLRPHPDSRCAAVTSIEVEVVRTDALTLRYVLSGRIDQIRLPSSRAPELADELWRHTCFEAFARPAPGEAYTELNFSPSTQWAAYHFTGYRRDMKVAADVGQPRIETSASENRYELRASVAMPLTGPCKLGISAVIEGQDGAKSYWALAHPPGNPDFHHDVSFAYDLP